MGKKTNLSENTGSEIPNGADLKIGIVTAEWNEEITGALYKGAVATLKKNGVKEENIISKWVPGTFELTLGSQWMAEHEKVDAIIALGCVIQGQTRHFDFICEAVSIGLTQLNIRFSKPVIFGVLTTNDLEQAKDRSGGEHGNKGDEAAITALKMVGMKKSFSAVPKKIGY